MTYIQRFLRFWYNSVVGDDWSIAAGVVVALGLTAVLEQRGVNAWWLMPRAVTHRSRHLASAWREPGRGVG